MYRKNKNADVIILPRNQESHNVSRIEIFEQSRFGQVCKGMLPNFKAEVAIKRVSHEPKQGLR